MIEKTIAFALRARDLMQTALMTVTPETSLLDIHRMFVEEEIHGAPVVDEDGVVRGVVSSLDLLRVVRDECDPDAGSPTAYFRDNLGYAGPDWTSAPEDFQERMSSLTAKDAMTRELVSVTPDTPVAEVARTMRDQHIHRVLVIDQGELIGVITTFDLLQAFIEEPPRKGKGEVVHYDRRA